MGCEMSHNSEIPTKNRNHGLIIMNDGDGRPETILMAINGVPYVWRVGPSGKYSLKMLAESLAGPT